jgi:16S rRNA (cytidine1402-2'-O)-methyltransferase
MACLMPALTAELHRALERSLAPPARSVLSLVATPIGNLADITIRAIATLATADIVYAEDTRHSATLFSHYGLRPRVRPYHEHNAERERPAILALLADGKHVALVSDAGMPLISDPGYKLVRECLELGHTVACIPGPSATLTALVSSGLPTNAFHFAGFLPARAQARRTRLKALGQVPATLIFFETANRLPEVLAELAEAYGPRPAAVARELTKLNEEMIRSTLPELAAEIAARPNLKGEIVLLVAPPLGEQVSDADILAALEKALEQISLRDAAKLVADELGVAKGHAYALGLTLSRTQTSEEPGDEDD